MPDPADTFSDARARLETRLDDVVPLLDKLVQAPSPNPPGDERAAAKVVREYLDKLPGVDLTVLGPSPQRPTLVFGHGSGRPILALSAHVDTHGIHGDWATDPYRLTEDDGRLFGLGTTDNKGAVAAMAAVFRSAAEHGLGRPGRLLLIANADEETGGRYGIEAIRDALPDRPDAVIVAEPSGTETGYERLYIAARGTSRFRLTTTGVETHSSLADHPGVRNAARSLEIFLAAFRDHLPLLDARHPLFDLGPVLIPVRLEAGKGWGVIPSRASVELELRLTPGHGSQAEIEKLVLATLEAASAETGVTAEFEFAEGSLRWMAPSEVAIDDPIVAAAQAGWADTFGTAPALGCFPGGTDARLFSEIGIPTLSGVGPGTLSRAHHPNEYVTAKELHVAVRLYAAITARYLRQEIAR